MTMHNPLSVAADVVHLEFEVVDPSYPFIGLSTIGGCSVELEEMLPRQSGGHRGFYSIQDGDPAKLLETAAKYDGVEAKFLDRTEDGGLLELAVPETCPGMFLAERRACPRRVTAVDGVGRITAELLPGADEHEVVDAFLSEYPTAELRIRRQESYHTPMFSHRELDREIDDLLTHRQQEALRTAYEAGYYEWPRENTGEELAATLGIAPATFAEQLRVAEQKLIGVLYG